RLLDPWIKQGRGGRAKVGPWVQLAVPESQVFQAVVPITHANLNTSPQSYFLEAVQATNVRAEERIIDLLKLELNKQPIACVAASPRVEINSMIEMMDGLGTRVGLAEPAPDALYRAGAFYHKAPRASKLTARFFLGPQQAIGVLAAGAQPLFWHTFDLTPGDESTAILAANSTLWMLARHSRITLPIDAVIVHGRPELALTQDPEVFRKRTGARLFRCAKPDYDLAAAALGVALANLLSDETGHDLARTLKPAISIREIFPWGELALQGVLLGVVSLFLIGTAAEAHSRLKAVDTQLRSFSWLKREDQAKLDADKKALQERLKVVEAFEGKRVRWSTVLRTVAAAAPESTTITGLSGEAEVETTTKGAPAKSKKQLIVNFSTPMAEDGSVPPEIEGFLAALRGDAMLKRHFPLIEVTGFKANSGKGGKHSFTSYSVVCLPKAEPIRTAAEPTKKATPP
ncbi:MAG TPA: hypothetical protein VKA15_24975, partial [Isosphaeraceae bacterium]|nr:hypothetical protein [Isosphaeraceae bacterium]